MRVRAPVDLIPFRPLLAVGLRHLLLGETMPEWPSGERKQFRVNPTDAELGLIDAAAEAFGLTKPEVVSRALALAKASNLSPCPDAEGCEQFACPGPDRRGDCPKIQAA